METGTLARNVDPSPMHIWITAAAGIALFAAGPASNDMLRGQWQQDTGFRITSLDGKAPPPALAAEKRTSDRSCYGADETRSIADFLRAGVKRQCAGLTIRASNGRLSVSGSCRFGGGSLDATGGGSYSATDFELTIHGVGQVNGHRVTISGSDSGHWLGTCSA